MAFFERLVRLHERMVLGVAYRLLGRMEDAQDAAQEVFLRLFQKHKQIEGDPKPWLYRVTVNVCNDWYRKRIVVAQPDEQAADPSNDVLATITLDERKRLLKTGSRNIGRTRTNRHRAARHRRAFHAGSRKNPGRRGSDGPQPDFGCPREARQICEETLMTCQECELKLGMGEDAAEHLASCAECRLLAYDLRLDAVALREMRVRSRMRWEPALRRRSGDCHRIGLWRVRPPETPPQRIPADKIVGIREAHNERRLKPAPQAEARATGTKGRAPVIRKETRTHGASARKNVHVRPGRGDLLDCR